MSADLVVGAVDHGGIWMESRLLPVLERIAVALETIARQGGGFATGGESPRGFDSQIRAFRDAIREGDWEAAADLLADLPHDEPRKPNLVEEHQRARESAAEKHRKELEAARQANDPERVIHQRDQLAKLLADDLIVELDRTLVRWFLSLIMSRLRGGRIAPDVAGLAARVADRFGGTVEGASLRASLPTLRRSAGLCPRCAAPYKGTADACPECLKPAIATPQPGEPNPWGEAADALDALVKPPENPPGEHDPLNDPESFLEFPFDPT